MSYQLTPTQRLASGILEAVGLDPNAVTVLTLHIDCNSIPWLTVEMPVLDHLDDLGEALVQIREFELREPPGAVQP